MTSSLRFTTSEIATTPGLQPGSIISKIELGYNDWYLRAMDSGEKMFFLVKKDTSNLGGIIKGRTDVEPLHRTMHKSPEGVTITLKKTVEELKDWRLYTQVGERSYPITSGEIFFKTPKSK